MLKSAEVGKKIKGTVTYLSDVIVAITSMFSTLFMLFVAGLVVFLIHTNITSTVYGENLYETAEAGSALTAVLDSKDSSTGVQVKDLLAYSVWVNSENFDYNGAQADLKKIVSSISRNFGLREYSSTLTIGGKNILLAKSGIREEKNMKCAEHKIFADGEAGVLRFCTSLGGG